MCPPDLELLSPEAVLINMNFLETRKRVFLGFERRAVTCACGGLALATLGVPLKVPGLGAWVSLFDKSRCFSHNR